MKTTKLGTLETVIVGTRPGRAHPAANTGLRLRREPENPLDPSAIAVQGKRGRAFGYLPRETAAWLARLMDRGWVELTVRPAGEASGGSTPAELEVRLTAKGQVLLEPPEEPRTPAEELHAEVLHHWPPVSPTARSAISSLADRLAAGPSRAVLPETHLLLEITPARRRPRTAGRRASRRGTAPSLNGLLERATVGAAVSAGPLSLFPITLPEGADPGVASFDAASAAGHIEITEISDGGSVNELKVTNRGPEPVLLPQGLVVVGGKQDRMIAIAVVVPAGAKRTVPVNCVEAGRWNWESGVMSARRVATPSIRREVLSLNKRAVASVQHEVWDEVRCCSKMAGFQSSTEALDEVYDHVDHGDLGRQLAGALPKGTSGLVASSGSRLLGYDLFGGAGLFDPMRDRLIEAWAVEARCIPAGGDGATAPGDLHALMLDAAAAARPDAASAVDGATRLIVETGRLTGSILLHGEHLLHMALLPVE